MAAEAIVVYWEMVELFWMILCAEFDATIVYCRSLSDVAASIKLAKTSLVIVLMRSFGNKQYRLSL